MSKLVSIVIPVAKEGVDLYRSISNFAARLTSLARRCGFSFEVLLVTDVFHRPTLKAMSMLARQGIARSILLTCRVGKGGSVKNAIPYIQGDLVVLLDADVPITPELLCKAVQLVSNTGIDLLVANRVQRAHSLLRRVLSIAYNNLVNFLFRTGLRDHQAGLKVLRRRAAHIILAQRVRTDGFAYDTEVIVWAKKHGLKYRALDIVWIEQRNESTIPTFRALLTILADLAMLRLLTIASKHVALQKQEIGKVIELPSAKTLGKEYMTVIRAAGPKKYILNALRKLYIAVMFKK